MSTEKKLKDNTMSAYTISKGSSPLHYKLIKLVLKGKTLEEVEVLTEEILPVVLGKVEQLLHEERYKS
jgi:hypothetical protein